MCNISTSSLRSTPSTNTLEKKFVGIYVTECINLFNVANLRSDF